MKRRKPLPKTFIATYAKVACSKLYDWKTPVTAADQLDDCVLLSYEEQAIPLSRVLTGRRRAHGQNPVEVSFEDDERPIGHRTMDKPRQGMSLVNAPHRSGRGRGALTCSRYRSGRRVVPFP